MKIIAFTGRARAGKDTAARMTIEWVKEHGAEFVVRQGFADLLKLSAFRALGGSPSASIEQAIDFCNDLKAEGSEIRITIPTPAGSKKRTYTITGREFLQWYGTEAHREVFGAEFWVDALFDYVEAHEPDFGNDVLIIPDCRFNNEAAAVFEARGGDIWEVTRPQHADELKSGLEHVSETGIDPSYVTARINNNGTLEDLQATIECVCRDRLEVAE